ncbi:hypothetical protein MUK42_11397 [Musa troglodytarum]|uniref:LisH domain-containing protein n=1 Tax=Musa troglodytarum TaxID=320322 RepID=A0A9E7GN80_9LILI|nr:hypothetical protein MUK42_11397 [Musa troglodytarum]
MDAAGPSSKRAIMDREWERRLKDVRIREVDVNKLVMNYLVTEGYAETADKFRIESGTEPDVDLATVFERRAVLSAVESCYVKEATEKLNSLDPMIDFLKEFMRTTVLFPRLGPAQRLKLVSQSMHESPNQHIVSTIPARAGMGRLRWDRRAYGADPAVIPVGVFGLHLATMEHVYLFCSGCPCAEPKLPTLLKMLICIQNELDENAAFPLVCDLTTTEHADTEYPYHLSF